MAAWKIVLSHLLCVFDLWLCHCVWARYEYSAEYAGFELDLWPNFQL